MPWYKAGTVSVVQNSNAVIGAGTAFIANSRVGDAFRGPDGSWYEVTNIAGDTAMSISPNYQGATNAAGTYALAPMQGYVKDSADALRALVNQFGGVVAVLGNTPTQAGVRASLNLTNTDGLPEGPTNKYMSATGVRSIPMTGLDLTTNTPVVAIDSILISVGKLQAQLTAVAAQVVSQGYIDGLIPYWNAGSSITISSGAAFIQGTGKVLRLPASVSISGIGGLNPDVFYYVYLYDNAGTPAVELSPTAPAAPFFGTARSKAGDTSRRLICPVRSGAAGTLYGFQAINGLMYYATGTAAAPFRRLSGGGSTTYVSISLSPVVPPTTQTAVIRGSAASGVAAVSNSVAGAGPMTQFDAGARYQMPFPTAGDQSILYAMLSAGTFTLDVCGYGMDR